MANITSGGSKDRVAKVDTVSPTTALVPRSRAVTTDTRACQCATDLPVLFTRNGHVGFLLSALQVTDAIRTDDPEEFVGLL